MRLWIACFFSVFLGGPSVSPCAQDDPIETRAYPVGFLTRPVEDSPGIHFSLAGDAIGQTVVSEDSHWSPLAQPELESLIKRTLAPGSWEKDGIKIFTDDATLTVTHKKSVHDRIAAFLAYGQGVFGKRVGISAVLVSIEPQLLARIRSEGAPDRPMALSPEQLASLLGAAREGKQAEIIKSMRLTARNGQRVNLCGKTSHAYVRDVDVQVTEAGGIAVDPVVDVLTVGTVVDVRPSVEEFGNAVTLEIRTSLTELEAMQDRALTVSRSPQVPSVVKVQLPRVMLDTIRTTVTARDRETVLIGTTLRKNRNLVFLLTPTVIPPQGKPATPLALEEQRLLRIMDLGLLTRTVPNFMAPRIDFVSPSASGPLAAATFILDEPGFAMSASDLMEMIRSRVAPGTWQDGRASMTDLGGRIAIVQKPEVFKQLEETVGSLAAARARMITTDLVILGFRKGSLAAWEKSVPALAGGSPFVEADKMQKLLEEAFRGDQVRMVDRAEITSFPREQVHSTRLTQEAYVQDIEPQVAGSGVADDPIISILTSGFVAQVEADFSGDAGEIVVELKASSGIRQLLELDKTASSASNLQLPRFDKMEWNSSVTCAGDKYSVVAMESRGRGEEQEEFVLLVRARVNILK